MKILLRPARKGLPAETRTKSRWFVGEHTWGRLTTALNLPILDAVDVYDPTFDKEDATYIRKAGGNPLLIGGACNGVDQMVSMIASAGRNVLSDRRWSKGPPPSIIDGKSARRSSHGRV
jgi:hypothetical protein